MSPIDQPTTTQHHFDDEATGRHEGRRLSRRAMVRMAGGAVAAATIAPAIGVSLAGAQGQGTGPQSPLSVPENDSRIFPTTLTYTGAEDAQITGYQVVPIDKLGEALPLVMVCPDEDGLTEHIKDVTRRLAVEGYIAVAVDPLSRSGGTSTAAQASASPAAMAGNDLDLLVGDFQALIGHYDTSGEADLERIGMTGFGFGGDVTWRAATQIPELKAAVAWYGENPPLEEVPNIHAAVLGIYSDDASDAANAGKDDLEAALQDAGVTYELKEYPGTQRGFHNDSGERYNQEQAQAAWNDMLDWFAQYLMAGDSATPMATPQG